jgi:DNA-binding NarL/FixJ family response regulator
VSQADGAATVVVADDHAPTRAGVRQALEADGFSVVAEASTARAAVQAALVHRPHVCLLDIHMPGSGIAAAEQISRDVPGTAVVMLTYSRESEDLFDSLRAGARGFLIKDMDPDRLGAALHGVIAGEAALPRSLVSKVLDEFRGRSGRKVFLRQRRPAELTSREWEIMELLRQGLTTEDVATRLFVSAGTVRVHVSSVLRKLQVASRKEALEVLREA